MSQRNTFLTGMILGILMILVLPAIMAHNEDALVQQIKNLQTKNEALEKRLENLEEKRLKNLEGKVIGVTWDGEDHK